MSSSRSDPGEATIAVGSQVRVRLVKAIHPDVEYDTVVVSDDGTHIVVRGPWAEEEVRDLGFVRFEPGDVFTEHYWRNRWYSVKEVRGGGVLKGWYCDVARPVRVEIDGLVSEDLDLDLWVSADGQTVLRLDEDEFAASGLAETDPTAVTRAVEALVELERLAMSGFDGIETDDDPRPARPGDLMGRNDTTVTIQASTAESVPDVRLVACDLDGTLLRSDGTLSSRTVAAIKAIEAREIEFVIATARAPRTLLPLVALYDIGGLAICGNGSLLVELGTGRLIRNFPMAPDLAVDLVRRLRDGVPGCAFAVEVLDRFGHETAYVPMHEVPANVLVEEAAALASRAPTKLLIQHRDLTITELFERVRAICGTLANAHYSSDSFVEITAPGIDKASALAELCEDLGIDRGAVVAIGDMPIDLPMLAWAGRSVAVANAHPDVLAAARETVASNDEDGVADLLDAILAA